MRQSADNTPAEEAAWLRVAGEEKAANIMALAPPDVRTVLEIGAGAGAVLEALNRKGFAEQYWACEPSSELLGEMPTIGRLVASEPKSLDAAFPGMTFDLAILSHVLEHLFSPAVLLSEALGRAKYVVVEVPLEGNMAGNARAWVRERQGVDRLSNEAGHVQFFSRRSVAQLVSHAGGQVVAARGYFPRAPYEAAATKSYQRAVLAASRLEGLARHYHEHYAVLCTKRSGGAWSHIYAQPV